MARSYRRYQSVIPMFYLPKFNSASFMVMIYLLNSADTFLSKTNIYPKVFYAADDLWVQVETHSTACT